MIELLFLKQLMLIKQVHQECDVCHYCYFLNYSVKFEPNVWNRCHDLLMMSMSLSDIAILNIKGCNYCCIISLIRKNEAMKLMQNADSTEKSGTSENTKICFHI